MGTDNRLAACLAPVLRDLAAAGVPAPEIRDEPWYLGPDALTAVAYSPDGSGLGIRVLPGVPFADQVAVLADQFQGWAVEVRRAAGMSGLWPECPVHPNSHPLRTDVDTDTDNGIGAGIDTASGRAVWRCPESGRIVSAIGELPSATGR